MRRLLIFAAVIVLLISCGESYVNGIKIEKGDTKTYETKEYIIVYEVEDFDNFGEPYWKFKEIRNKNYTDNRDTLKDGH